MPRLSPEQHAAMAKCLREARELLWDGTGTYPYGENARRVYICIALRATSADRATQALCSNWIKAQLEGSITYVGWLGRFVESYPFSGVGGVSRAIQVGRLAWLDNMIKVLEE